MRIYVDMNGNLVRDSPQWLFVTAHFMYIAKFYLSSSFNVKQT